MRQVINPYMRCGCGKIHIITYVSRISRCSCGIDLHRLYMAKNVGR